MNSKDVVAVVGLGYVGLPLALLIGERGHRAIGIDIDEHKIGHLQKGRTYIDGIKPSTVKRSKVHFTTAIDDAKDATIVIICVPTPVTDDRLPDLRPLEGAVQMIAPLLKRGSLVVIESTVNPGVCDDVVIPLIESVSKHKVGRDIDVVHCPERINPGDPQWHVKNINRVLGGNSPRALKRGLAFYRGLIDATITPMQSLKEAEAVKVVENSFRDINIAFVNELAMSFHVLGIDVERVIEGASTKPFSFMPHYPGCGVGGHCIPVDPYYLIEYSKKYDFDHRFLRLARSINEEMPRFTVELLTDMLQKSGTRIDDTHVGLLGLSYKSNVGDDRESPAYAIRRHLHDEGFKVTTFDPFIPGKSDVESLDKLLAAADALVIATGHKAFERLSPALLNKHGVKIVIDGRNMLRARKNAFKKAGVKYTGIGQC